MLALAQHNAKIVSLSASQALFPLPPLAEWIHGPVSGRPERPRGVVAAAARAQGQRRRGGYGTDLLAGEEVACWVLGRMLARLGSECRNGRDGRGGGNFFHPLHIRMCREYMIVTGEIWNEIESSRVKKKSLSYVWRASDRRSVLEYHRILYGGL